MTDGSPIDRREQLARMNLDPNVVVCGDCWEPVRFQLAPGEEPVLIAGRRSSGWKHVRTGVVACRPLCDGCGQDKPTTPYQRLEFDGAGMRWKTLSFWCAECRQTLRELGRA